MNHTCDYCRQPYAAEDEPYTDGVVFTCTVTHVVIGGVRFPRIRLPALRLIVNNEAGTESIDEIIARSRDGDEEGLTIDDTEVIGFCWFCGVLPGGLHHPPCEREHCPRCAEEMGRCDCRKVFEEPVSEEAVEKQLTLLTNKLINMGVRVEELEER